MVPLGNGGRDVLWRGCTPVIGSIIPFMAPSSSFLACPIVFATSVICFSIHEKESSEDMQIIWNALDICFLLFLAF